MLSGISVAQDGGHRHVLLVGLATFLALRLVSDDPTGVYPALKLEKQTAASVKLEQHETGWPG